MSACIGRRSVNPKGIDRPALFAFPGKRNTPSACFQNRQNQKGPQTFQRKKLPSINKGKHAFQRPKSLLGVSPATRITMSAAILASKNHIAPCQSMVLTGFYRGFLSGSWPYSRNSSQPEPACLGWEKKSSRNPTARINRANNFDTPRSDSHPARIAPQATPNTPPRMEGRRTDFSTRPFFR